VKQRGRGTLPKNKGVTVKLPTQETRRKRVYKSVAVVHEGNLFGVALDDRPLHTPGRTKLETPSKALAEAISVEWDSQTEHITPGLMPLTKLLNTSLDRIAPNADTVVADLLSYLDTDLLCYRVDDPPDLVERQSAIWQPVLDWLAHTHDVVLTVGTGLMPLSHPDESHRRAEQALAALNTTELTCMQATAGLTASLSLGLALVGGKLSSAETAAAANLDETWQMEKWGEDQEALDRIAGLASDILAVETFMKLST
jgi:chaperone required for assembly of F1-ATPase